MKKMLMALLLCAALLPLCAGACAAENTPVYIEPAEAFAGGSGTAEDPFQIAKCPAAGPAGEGDQSGI